MTLVRRLARPCIAGIFISGGVDQFRAPHTKTEKADAVAQPITKAVPWLPENTETLVKINGAVQVGAGLALALGKFPRAAALVLIGSLVPTTAAGHRFWEEDDPAAQAQQTIHFLKNVGLLGGLLLAVADTGGRPSVPWMASRAAHRAGERAAHLLPGSDS
jgi:putative oxidoreductase